MFYVQVKAREMVEGVERPENTYKKKDWKQDDTLLTSDKFIRKTQLYKTLEPLAWRLRNYRLTQGILETVCKLYVSFKQLACVCVCLCMRHDTVWLFMPILCGYNYEFDFAVIISALLFLR